MPADTLQTLGRFFAGALEDYLGADENLTETLLNALGWEAPPGLSDLGLNGLNPAELVRLIGELDLRVDGGSGDSSISLQLHAQLFTELQSFLTRATQFATNLNVTLAGTGDYLARSQIVSQFTRRFFDFAIIRFAEKESPAAHALLLVAGIFRIEFRGADPAVRQVSYLHHEIDLAKLGLLLSNPPQLFRDTMGWGTPNLKIPQLVALVGYMLQMFGLPGVMQKLPRRVEERLFGRLVPEADSLPLPRVLIHLAKGVGWDPLAVGIAVFGVRPTTPGGADGGIGFSPFLQGTSEIAFALTDRFALEVQGGPAIAKGVALLVRPNGATELKGDILSGGPLKKLTETIALRGLLQSEDQKPFRLLSIPGGSRLEVQEFALAFGGGPDLFVEIEMRRSRFVLSLGEGNSLLTTIIPKDAVQANVDLAIGWKAGRVYLRGSANLQATFPVHLSIGPVELQTVTVGLTPAAGKLPIAISATVKATLGPLTMLVEQVGLTADFGFPGGASGNLGPLNVGLGFKVPSGIALELDAGPISGGGYLFLDPAGKRYGGALKIKLPIASVAAFGIYEEVGGEASFVAVLGIRFTPGIQLSFGFTLNGVGGIVGLNRRADTDLLRDRLATGAAGNVLFCEDPIKNAPSLLGDLAAFFPAKPSCFLLGPTLQIGWLSPIVRVDLGIIIALPGPSSIIILGSIRVMIGADETLALLYLRMDILGIIDFEKELISLDAHLVGSHALGIFRLTGGMALRWSWGSSPFILLSVGGFHPRFDPGPLCVPALARVGASLDVSFVAKVYLRLEMYVAFTSNTLQAGAKVEAGMSLGPLQASGYFYFDALVQFRPFAFEVDFSAGFDIRAFGISFANVDVAGRISGPGPIVVHARGSVKRLCFKVSASATFEIGDRNPDPKTAIPSVVKALEPELSKIENLRAEGEDATVSLKPERPKVPGAFVSPKGVLIWEQKRVPLQTIIHRFEGAELDGQHELHLDAPTGWTASEESDWFNPGRFTTFDLHDSQAMNNATFQELPSGLRIGLPANAHAPRVEEFDVTMQLFKRPEPIGIAVLGLRAYMNAALSATFRERSASPEMKSGPAKVSVKPETFAVHDASGTALGAKQTPFQAFQISRQSAGRVATPSTDEVVML